MFVSREVDSEITGVLTLFTTGSDTQTFDVTTGTQTYTWNNINWAAVLGFVPAAESVWEVTHSWDSGANPTQSINALVGPNWPTNPSASLPFVPVFFVGCNIAGNNSTPTVFNTINNIYCQQQQVTLTNSWLQFGINLYCNDATFVAYSPENSSRVTIVTRPSKQVTYVSSNGPPVANTPVVQSYPADYYTNGVHTLKFRLLKKL